MTNLIIILGLMLGLSSVYLYIRHKDRVSGRNEEKLKQSVEAISNVKKANAVKSDNTYDDELRKKYDR